MKILRIILPITLLLGVAVFLLSQPAATLGQGDKKNKSKKPAPIRALLITGGCCHDYNMQKDILMSGIKERANVEWSFVYEQFGGKDHKIGRYLDPNWAKGFDVIVHNECYGGVTDSAFVDSIVKAHTDDDIGAVMLHCSMHSYRAAETDSWRALIGASSYNHGKKHPIAVKKLSGGDHPVIAAVPEDWTTLEGELYNTNSKAHPDAKMWDSATQLAEGSIPSTEAPQTCIWLNEYEGSKVFSTTIGHHNETMMDPVYLDLVTRGLLWTVGKLDENGKPVKGAEAQQ